MQEKTILLIDDDQDDQLIFSEAVAELSMGLTCITAENGLEALNLLSTISILPDIIFLDLNMPVMKGDECLEQLKKNDLLKSIPVIIYSTSNHPSDILKTSRLGAAHFFTKTDDFNELKTKISSLVSQLS